MPRNASFSLSEPQVTQGRTHRYPNRSARLQWLRKPVPAEADLANAVQRPLPAEGLRSAPAHKDSLLLWSVTRLGRFTPVGLGDAHCGVGMHP
jgi:hypothetical protein